MSAASEEGEPRAPGARATLVRGRGGWDAALITGGTMLGSSIFIAAAFVPRALPHPALVLGAWVLGGLLVLTGALTFAELGAMFPRAGGIYHFLREAFGSLPAFLFGWASFFIAQTGACAYLGVAFGEYLGVFFPSIRTSNVIAAVPLGVWTLRVTAVQAAAVLAILALTWVNYLGLKQGAGVQNLFTILKIGAVLLLGVAGLAMPARTVVDWTAPLPSGHLLAALGIALVGIFGAYDGWYQATFSAGEMRDPQRDLPRGMLAGVLSIMAVYLLLNVVYLRALPIDQLAASSRIGEAAATSLLGPIGGRWMALAVLLSLAGALSSTILTASRIYQPMAEDGVFFRGLARIHPRYRTPSASVVAQGLWATLLVFWGSYEQLLGDVVFVVYVFHAATGLAVFKLRRSRPDAPRPYRVWGYPWVPLIFVVTSLLFVADAVIETPKDSMIGLGAVALGIPAYFWWRASRAHAT